MMSTQRSMLVRCRALALALACLPAMALGATEASNARGHALEQDRLARDPSLLRILGHDFDPLTQTPCPADDRAALCDLKEIAPTAAGDAPTWLLQVLGRPMDARAALEAADAEILGYYPNAAWLVRAPAARLAALRRLPLVRWLGGWSPAWKLPPGLLSRKGRVVGTPVTVAVTLQPGARIAAWKAHLEATPGATIVAMHESPTMPTTASLELTLPPEHAASALLWLASLRDVAQVVERSPLLPLLDAAVPWAQTGIGGPADYDLSAKLFAKGITGRGVLVALADDGLENDDCRFTFGSAVTEAAWPLGPSADSVNPLVGEGHFTPGLPPPLRTRERKVTAYYVQTGANASSTVNQHGSMVAACIAGDANEVLAARPMVRDIGELQDVFPMNPSGEWVVGEILRPDLQPRLDNPAISESRFPTTFGQRVQHHQSGDGAAPGAQLIFQDIARADASVVPLVVDSLMLQAERSGASAFNLSWGGPPCLDCYQADAVAADLGLWMLRDLAGFGAVGNDGSLGVASIGGGIAHAKSVISVGASSAADSRSCSWCSPPVPRSGEDVASYSSRGPSSGGRIAPEILLPGDVIVPMGGGALPSPEDGSGSGDFGCGGPAMASGTSLASGHAAGLAALVGQYFRDGYYPTGRPDASNQLRPTNALIRAVLVNSTRDLMGARTDDAGVSQAHRPNFGQGWGAPRLDDTLFFAGDPTADDPLGGTERAAFVVLTDTPNGVDGSVMLSPEPGGRTRDAIVQNFQPAVVDGVVQEFIVAVANPDPSDVANDLRFTLAWSDAPGLSATDPLVNDLDLEVVSPGPDGLLQSASGATLLGDDIVYRPNPLSAAWDRGASQPSTIRRLQTTRAPFDTTLADADRLNTVENVFVPASEAAPGAWRVRVIGYSVPGTLSTGEARPSFVLGDRPPVLDMNGDGVPDLDITDAVSASDQGYALIVSGRFAIVPITRPRVPVPPMRPPRRPPRS